MFCIDCPLFELWFLSLELSVVVPSVAPLEVDMTLHGDNRLRLVAEMKRNGVEKAGLILLQGGESEMRHDTGKLVCLREHE